jgi:hypothetical protein
MMPIPARRGRNVARRTLVGLPGRRLVPDHGLYRCRTSDRPPGRTPPRPPRLAVTGSVLWAN